jgi:hypothetical protein
MTDDIGTPETDNVVELRRKHVGKAPSGLTFKQEAFVMALADGATNSEAYRTAYDASGMAMATVHSKACMLAADARIKARLGEVLAERRAKKQHVTAQTEERLTERVWRNVWRLAENAESQTVQATAIALAAKMAGMITEKQEVKQIQGDTATLEAELKARLAKHLKAG